MFVKYAVILNLFSTALLVFCPVPAVAAQSVRLNWVASSSPDAAGYNIYYGSQSGVYTAALSVVGTTTITVDDLQDGLTYYFAVSAYNNSGSESDLSNEASYSIPGTAPPEGTPFIAQILPDHAITLGWNPSPSRDVQGYYVHYGTQSGSYDRLVWVPADTQLDIHNLAEGVTYYFAVTATNSSGAKSTLTAEVSYIIPLIAPPQGAPTVQQIIPAPVVRVNWNVSPSADVAGYIVHYGTQSGYYDNSLYVGSANSVDIGGLLEGLMYYFAVTAYDSFGQESVFSPEASYFVEITATVVDTNVFLSLQQIPVAGFPNAFSVTATGPVPATWTLESSSNLKTWHTLATGDDPEVNVAVVISEKPALFFRLNSWFEDMTLAMQADGTNRYPNSFVVTTPHVVPSDWTLESSEDLQNWSPFVTGYFAPVKVAIVNAPTPALFFRLKGG